MGKIVLKLLVLLSLSAVASVAPASGRHFDRAVIVIFENTDYGKVLSQPFFGMLASRGVNFTNFTAETHPSQANYIALTSGSENGVRGDGNIDIDSTNIVDLLEAKGLTWKVYAEDYPGHCFIGAKSGNYYRKHNPFISYLNISKNPDRCAHIVNASQFDQDLAAGQLPNYVFYVPDIKNDGHDTGVKYADQWYQNRFSSLLSNPAFMDNTLLISTFDESGSYLGNHTYTTFYGPMLRPGLSVTTEVNHYGILRMLEDNWDLGTLGREDDRASMTPEIWK